MKPNALREKWRAGETVIGGWCNLPSSFSAEVMAHMGFDWLCVDTQHGLIDYTTAIPMLQAIGTTDTVPIVRVPINEQSIIGKYLDAGAYGIIIPLVNTREEAERAVAACRYPPVGIRSAGPTRANYSAGGNYVAEANGQVLCIVMIETAEAIENLDAILSVPGVDVAYIGPSDLSFALGLPPRPDNDDPRHIETTFKIRDACLRHGVVPAIHCSAAGFAAKKVKDGFKMVMLTSDILMLSRGTTAELKALREGIT